jgi:pre-60S factor REI1
LKRKVAELPPVTREWFEAHIQQLAAGSGPAATRVWMDPLTNKKFGSEQTYNVYVNSKRYKELVRKTGVAAPAAIVRLKTANNEGVTRALRTDTLKP